MLSLALYQSHIVLTAVICLFSFILDVLAGENAKKLWVKLGCYVGTGAIGVVLYLISVRVSVQIWNIGLSSYKGIASMGTLKLSKSFQEMFSYIWKLYFSPVGLAQYQYWTRLTNGRAINIVFVALFACLLVWCVVRARVLHNKAGFCLLLVCILSLPFAWSVIVYMAPEVELNILISSQLPFLYIFTIILASETASAILPVKARLCRLVKVLSMVLCGIIIWNYIFLANQLYYASTLAANRTAYMAQELNSRIESRQDWSVGQKIAILGEQEKNYYYPDYYSGLYGAYTQIYWQGYGGQASWHKYMLEKFGRYYEPVTYEEYNALLASKEFLEMDSFPSAGCIRQIGDVLVIKLSDQ